MSARVSLNVYGLFCGLFCSVVSFFLTGCATIVIAYPPLPMHGTDLNGLEQGEVSAQTGVNGLFVVAGDAEVSAGPDILSGMWDGSLGFGLPGGFDLRLGSGVKFQGANWNLQLGKDLVSRDEVEAGLFVGAGWAFNRADFKVTDGMTGEMTRHNYSYLTLVPNLGARATFPIYGALKVPVGARLSWSQVVPIKNVRPAQVYGAPWFEVQTGLLVDLAHLSLSLDLGGVGTPSGEGALPFAGRFGVSLQGAFPVGTR